MSLKKELHKLIRTVGRCSYNDALSLCLRLGRKPSNMERTLRPSNSPQIETIYNHKGHVSAYKWREICHTLLILVFLGGFIGGIWAEPASSEPRVNLEIIAQIESSGDPMAWNKRDDSRGLHQITPICLKEYNNFHPGAEYSMDDLWDVSISTTIADWYMNKRIPQMIRHYKKPDTLANRLIAYNAGISYVKTGKQLPPITKLYLKKYRRLENENHKGWNHPRGAATP